MTARPVTLSREWRLLRASLLAVVNAVLAIAAHGVATGGDLPDTGVVVLVCLGVGWVATAVADRPRSRVVILAVLAGSQLVLHLVLSLQHSVSGHPVSGHNVSGHHQHAAGVPVVLTAHIVAVVLTGLLLATADSLLVAAATAVFALLPRRPFRLAASAPLWVAVPADAGTALVRGPLLTRICARRGPPS
jgi:hypothetical protein